MKRIDTVKEGRDLKVAVSSIAQSLLLVPGGWTWKGKANSKVYCSGIIISVKLMWDFLGGSARIFKTPVGTIRVFKKSEIPLY